MNLRFAAASIACAALTACASVPSHPQAVTAYSRSDCAQQIDFSAVQSLTPERQRAQHNVSAQVTAQTPCLTTAEGTSPYVAFALPADFDDKTLTIGAPLEMVRVFAPRVAVLDASGVVTRAFEPSQFMYRGPVYSVQFRPRAGESFVLVTADPALVGQRYDSINISTATSGTVAAGVYVSWTSGVDTTQSRVFSYEGTVSVIVSDSDTDN